MIFHLPSLTEYPSRPFNGMPQSDRQAVELTEYFQRIHAMLERQQRYYSIQNLIFMSLREWMMASGGRSEDMMMLQRQERIFLTTRNAKAVSQSWAHCVTQTFWQDAFFVKMDNQRKLKPYDHVRAITVALVLELQHQERLEQPARSLQEMFLQWRQALDRWNLDPNPALVSHRQQLDQVLTSLLLLIKSLMPEHPVCQRTTTTKAA